ncbi:aminotransferase [Marinomonas sp. SBI22]|uniref:aminotransferase class V-fold PLP-dependent enzyme n=1 Tax=unclassified Marinomonas TaxID=196814 RepID=UPI0007AFBC57|nr:MULTISPECIES: aminotransferase class V-fold PLP-dependent enzyme [unclassified Marinomonas]KZM42045.1 aminotransferase [Marinomonas sp. SBI22]KZM47112.1 aminotransferase [Marinomonas sp. SBI8L]
MTLSTQQNTKLTMALESVRQGLIGDSEFIETPFGSRKITYADYTASGRSLSFIESFITQKVMPFYANTHTEATVTGRQTSAYREDARQLIASACHANKDDVVLFCGSGATAAVDKLIRILTLAHNLNDSDTVIFIGPYEHHSNELPWRESGAKVVRIKEAQDGGICLNDLESQLQAYKNTTLKIGSFSAASNVTGIIQEQDAVAALLHQHQALSFWDFAAGAPYMKVAMNSDVEGADKDALFFSPHKLVGGPGTPGVLIIKRALLTNDRPSTVGGGTVSFVSRDNHTFLAPGERSEEAGTPAIIESIRAGLAFKVKSDIGDNAIEALEEKWSDLIKQKFDNNNAIEVLGNPNAKRLSITSFRVKTKFGYLHHGLVVSLLNDLFGIQMRAGCSCAGPYGHDLLNIDEQTSLELVDLIAQDKRFKPGWVRFNLNYFIAEEEAEFILKAIEFVAEHGLRLMSLYEYDQSTDLWLYAGKKAEVMSLSLGLDSLMQATNSNPDQVELLNIQAKDDLWQAYLNQAESLVKSAPLVPQYVLNTGTTALASKHRDFVAKEDFLY